MDSINKTLKGMHMAYNILCSLPDFAKHILAQPAPKMNGLCTWALILYSGYSKKYGTSWIHRRNITEWKWFKDWVHSKLYLGPHWTSFPRDFCSEECLHLWVCESIMQGVRGATVEKRGKVELSATSRPVRSQREAGFGATAYKSKPRPEAHQACLICP